jgi:hypothetical protein
MIKAMKKEDKEFKKKYKSLMTQYTDGIYI